MSADKTTELVVERLTKSYPAPSGSLSVLRDVNLRLRGGERLAITGPSGSGKSTLLHILGTLDQPTSGSVRVDGRDPFALSAVELARFRNHTVGFVFQDHHLLPQCTLLENVLLPTFADRDSKNDAEKTARELLNRVGLGARLDHRPAELSGGERQRAAIARALIRQPQLLLCDEPTGNLDRHTAAGVAELLLELAQAHAAILVVVTHSGELAERLGQRLELADGMLVE